MDYKKYLVSDTWKCGRSPTGAHHWIVDHEGSGLFGLCKYCGEWRKFAPVRQYTESRPT